MLNAGLDKGQAEGINDDDMKLIVMVSDDDGNYSIHLMINTDDCGYDDCCDVDEHKGAGNNDDDNNEGSDDDDDDDDDSNDGDENDGSDNDCSENDGSYDDSDNCNDDKNDNIIMMMIVITVSNDKCNVYFISDDGERSISVLKGNKLKKIENVWYNIPCFKLLLGLTHFYSIASSQLVS